MSRVDRTISSSESDIETSSESREEIHQIKEIECEKRVEQTKPKVRSKPMTKSRMYYWINKPINKNNKVVQWLRDNDDYQESGYPVVGLEKETIQLNRVKRERGETARQWLDNIIREKQIVVECPKPIRIIPGINDEVIQTKYEMIPKRSENVTLEMRLRNEQPEMDKQLRDYEIERDDGIRYEIVPPKPVDLSRMNRKKK